MQADLFCMQHSTYYSLALLYISVKLFCMLCHYKECLLVLYTERFTPARKKFDGTLEIHKSFTFCRVIVVM